MNPGIKKNKILELLLFMGIQATGKTSYYAARFVKTHVRISLDMLNTRKKEKRFFDLCLDTGQRCVVDNTNPSKADRSVYIEAAKTKQFRVIGFYFESRIHEALERNAKRPGKENIDERGVRSTYSKLEMPDLAEGFDELYFVRIGKDGQFETSNWIKNNDHEI